MDESARGYKFGAANRLGRHTVSEPGHLRRIVMDMITSMTMMSLALAVWMEFILRLIAVVGNGGLSCAQFGICIYYMGQSKSNGGNKHIYVCMSVPFDMY